MLPSTLLSGLLPLLASVVTHAEQTFYPASIPLSVRSPYLNIWLNSTAGAPTIGNSWPRLWLEQVRSLYAIDLQVGFELTAHAIQSIIGWDGRIRVDGTSYRWMGSDGASDAANLTSFQITPTRSIFVMEAGPMNFTVTYLSPIEVRLSLPVLRLTAETLHLSSSQPADWVKQSLPFSYMSVEAQSLDGASHSVQIYSDISAGTSVRLLPQVSS